MHLCVARGTIVIVSGRQGETAGVSAGSYFLNIHRVETTVPNSKRENKKSRLRGFCVSAREASSPVFSPQPRVKCFSLGLIKRQGCLPVPDVTSHSLILHTLLSISLLICTHLSPGSSQPVLGAKQPHKQGKWTIWGRMLHDYREEIMEMHVVCEALHWMGSWSIKYLLLT